MNKNMKTSKLTITKADGLKADRWNHCRACLVATAFKRTGADNVSVCSGDATVDGRFFRFDEAQVRRIYGVEQFDGNIYDQRPADDARPNLDLLPITLELTEVS